MIYDLWVVGFFIHIYFFYDLLISRKNNTFFYNRKMSGRKIDVSVKMSGQKIDVSVKMSGQKIDDFVKMLLWLSGAE